MYGRALVQYLKEMERFIALTPVLRARKLNLPR